MNNDMTGTTPFHVSQFVARRFVVLPTVALSVLLVLLACGDDAPTEDRRFANDPTPTIDPATPAVATDEAQPDVATITASPVAIQSLEDILAASTAASEVPIALGSELWSVDDSGGATLLLDVAPARILAVSSEPEGTQIALLIDAVAPSTATPQVESTPVSEDGTPVAGLASGTSLLVIDLDGDVLWRIENLEQELSVESPTGSSSDDNPVRTIAWRPASADVLIAFTDGSLVLVGDGVEQQPIMGSGGVELYDLAWADSGEAIAFVANREHDEPVALYFASLRTDNIDPVRVAPPGGSSRSVAGVEWLPGSQRLVFIDAAGGELGNQTLANGRDLFVTSLTGNRELVVAAGFAAPVAGIAEFAVSPDGQFVAFTVVVPGGEVPVVEGLYIQPIEGGTRIEIPGTTNVGISELTWIAGGLVWVQGTLAGDDEAVDRIMLLTADGTVRPLTGSDADVATPTAATPTVATPDVNGTPQMAGGYYRSRVSTRARD